MAVIPASYWPSRISWRAARYSRRNFSCASCCSCCSITLLSFFFFFFLLSSAGGGLSVPIANTVTGLTLRAVTNKAAAANTPARRRNWVTVMAEALLQKGRLWGHDRTKAADRKKTICDRRL